MTVPIANDLLLVSVVRRGRGDRVVAIAKSAGARGSTVLLGRGAAGNKILRLLCLADTEKEVIFTLAASKEMPPIIEALRLAPDLCKKMPGIGFTIDVTAFLHSGAAMGAHTEEARMQTGQNDALLQATRNQEHELICVIANCGYADDIMLAAREAGATGGTIVKARGTGTEKDGSFFGITIVPEKEMLMILAKSLHVDEILNAIRTCPALAEPGVGIVFCMPVERFFPLGKKANS